MPIRIAINGFGRIGRCILRALHEQQRQHELEIVAINELSPAAAVEHLLRYDSSHGRFPGEIVRDGEQLRINGRGLRLLAEPDPARLPWADLDVDVVLECTGHFSDADALRMHLDAGAKKVLLSQPPGNGEFDYTVIYGVNHDGLLPAHRIVSNGSCTSNCVIPVIDLVDRHFGVDSGAITTMHASMNDQSVIDAYHSDLRRARAASTSIIPVDTKLAAGIERVLPKFRNRFEAIAVRVPTINVTAMDLTLTTRQAVTPAGVNSLLQQASKHALHNILGYTEEALVSIDFNHDPRSSIVDGSLTRVSHTHLLKCLLWCDNEWGFANRMLDTAALMGRSLRSA